MFLVYNKSVCNIYSLADQGNTVLYCLFYMNLGPNRLILNLSTVIATFYICFLHFINVIYKFQWYGILMIDNKEARYFYSHDN